MKKYITSLLLSIILYSGTAYAAPNYAAKVNNTVISVEQLDTLFSAAKKQLSERERIDFSSQEGQTLLAATRRSLLDEIIDGVLLEQGAAQLGVTASAQEVEERIKKVQKEFPSKSVFSQALSEDNITPEDLRHGIHQEIMIEKIADKLGGSIRISESEIENFFVKNKELFAQPKRVQLFQILVANENDAQEVLEKLKKGASFKDMAKKYSLDQLTRNEGGEVGFIEEVQLPAYVAPIANELRTGYISAPLKAEEGIYIISCGEVLERKDNDISGSREQIKDFLIQEKKRAVYERWFEHLKDKASIDINPELFLQDASPQSREKPLEQKPDTKVPLTPKASEEHAPPSRTPLS